ncbi:hypothetical protein M432DRAFT_632658 [Thermoascus aurantiacus ATCC 26904]
MKVHHGRGPKQYYESPDRETNSHEFGLCDRGIIPQFYGTIENLDPKLCQPHLKAFLNDEYIPNAILLEYIPNMREFHWTNYTKQRMENFTRGINKIHKIRKALDDPERAIWIDFDRAQTFDMNGLTERQEKWIAFESELVAELGVDMVGWEADAFEDLSGQLGRGDS